MRDRSWSALLTGASRAVDFEGEVMLLQSPSADVPMTWGILRPVVLLPTYSESWPTEQRRAVLLHEMAHVARRDCLVQTLAEFACALYWFHPLTWFAARRLRVEREQACDDRVLSAGESAATYATYLLEVARLCRSLRFGGAVAAAMAHPSHLEGRLLAVLDGTRSRVVPGRRARYIGFACAALLLVALGGTTAASAPSPLAPQEVASTSSAQLISAESVESAPGPRLLGEENTPLASDAGASPILSEAAPPEVPAAEPEAHGAPGTQGAQVAEVAAGAQGALGTSGIREIPGIPGAPGTPDTGVVSSVAAFAGEAIRIDLPTGGEVRIVGWSRESVEVRTIQRGSAATPQVSLSRGGGEVRITSTFDSGVNANGSHRFEIRVPSSAHLRIDSRNGAITVDGLRGTVSGQTGGGDIRLENLNGELRLATARGEVMISNSDVTGEVRTEAGNLRLRNVKGSVHVITAAGEAFFENSGARFTAIKAGQ